MTNKNFFNNFLNDEFTKDFNESMESLLRLRLSAMSFYCKEVKDSVRDENTKRIVNEIYNNIMQNSFPLLKMAELYSYIKNAFEDNSETKMSALKLDDFLLDLINRTKSYISDKCETEYISGKSCFARTNLKYLNLILLMYIRKSVTDGAKKIEATFFTENKSAVIAFSVKEIVPESRFYFEDDLMNRELILKHFKEIADLWAGKINAEVILDGNDMKLKLPLDEGTVLYSRGTELLEDNIYNSYNYILSDFKNSQNY